MKGVLGWVKGHLVVVISVIVAIAALPALLFVSSGMNASLKQEVEEEIGSQQRALQQINVEYAAEPLDPTEQPVSFSAVPNEATTRAMERVLRERDQAATRTLELAVERNRAGKTPMLDGLFPSPDPAQAAAKRQAAPRAWVSAHRALLREHNAAGPLEASELRIFLETRQAQEREKRLSTLGVSELPAEAAQEIAETLKNSRLERLRSRAQDHAFYASMNTFEGVALPESAELASIEEIWDWQHRLWIAADIVRAAAVANDNPATGIVLTPDDRPVKRLVSIAITPWSYGSGADAEEDDRSSRSRRSRGRQAPASASAAGDLATPIRTDFNASLTGRAGWPLASNPLYTARYARVVAILDGAGVQRFIDALESVNFMTVVDLDLAAVSPAEGLVEGYAYGGGSLVRAEMVVETLWLHEWMAELAPDPVRDAMGLPPRETEDQNAASAQQADDNADGRTR